MIRYLGNFDFVSQSHKSANHANMDDIIQSSTKLEVIDQLSFYNRNYPAWRIFISNVNNLKLTRARNI